MTINTKITKNTGKKAELDLGSKVVDRVRITNEKIVSCVRTTKSIKRQQSLRHNSITMIEHYSM